MENKNFVKFSGHCFGVINQNGFNNALYSYFGDRYSKQDIRAMVQNFPKSYPCTIIIVDQSFECCRVYIEEIYINEIAHSRHSEENGFEHSGFYF